MNRRIVLMRHAKSSWKSGASDDHARPLNKRGKRDAPRVAARLVELGWVPELVVSSDAKRTRETYARMEDEFDPRPRVEFTRSLYLAGVNEVNDALRSLPEDVKTVMLLGHNDGWEEALEWLSGADEVMTTANAALLEGIASSWAETVSGPGCFRLCGIVRPRELD